MRFLSMQGTQTPFRTLALLVGVLLGSISLPGRAATDPAEIIRRAEANRKMENSVQKVRMVLVSKSGTERVREFDLKVRKDSDALRSYTRFTHPSDVAGTSLVVVDRPEVRDEQLLYLPALQRVNRISGKARTGSFMGSDFAFEDLELSGGEGVKHTLVSESAELWVIDTVPGIDSSYGRLRTTVRRSDDLPLKVEFFDKKGAALKVLDVTEWRVEGGQSIPVVSVMRHLQAGSSTRLILLEHRLNVPKTELPDEIFTAGYLERNP